MHTRRIYLFIGFYMVLVFAMAWSASSLRFNGNLESLLPSENPHVQAYEKLKELRSSEGGMDLVVKVGTESVEAIEATGTVGSFERFEALDSLQVMAMEARLVEQASQVAEFMMQDAAQEGGIAFSGVEWKSDLEDLQKNLFYLMTDRELAGIYRVIEEAIEEAKKEVNPFYFELESDSSEQTSLSPSELIARYKKSSTLLTLIDNAIPYEWNPEEGTIIVRFLLPFKQSEIDLLGATYDRALDLANEYEMMHSDVQLYWGGDYVDHYYRIQGIREAVGDALWIGLLALFVFLWLYMRKVGKEGVLTAGDLAFDMALMLGILAAGIVISLGIFSLLQKEINLFAAIIFSVLVGMNLDYLLHMYAMIRRGEALSWKKTAPIRYSALTTTLAIASLMFAELDGFVQLGIIVTINVPIHLGSCYLWLPFSAAARKGEAGVGVGAVQPEKNTQLYEWLKGGAQDSLMRWGGVTVGLMLVIGAYFGLEHVEFNSDFNSLEPVTRTLDFREAARKIPEPNFVREPSFLLAPSKDSAKIFFSELKSRLNDSNRGDDLGYIEQVESLVGRMPSDAVELERKRQKIEELQKLIAVNQEYMPGLEGDIQRYAEWALLAEVPTEDALPEYLLNRFSLRTGGLAPLILVYPNQNLSTGTRSLEYLENSGILYARDGTPYVLASTQLIAASVLKRLMADTRWVTIAPFLALFLVIFGIYRRVSWVAMALAPLVGTFLVLLSWNLLFNVPLHVYNVVVLPIIIGVSVDNGIHLVHSYQAHGKDFFEPFWSKVYPVLVGCSFTTVLGFVGLLFVNHPGMMDMGALAIGSISISVLVTLGFAMWLHSWLHRR